MTSEFARQPLKASSQILDANDTNLRKIEVFQLALSILAFTTDRRGRLIQRSLYFISKAWRTHQPLRLNTRR